MRTKNSSSCFIFAWPRSELVDRNIFVNDKIFKAWISRTLGGLKCTIR